MDIISFQEECQVYLEKGQKQWNSYFSRWEDLAQDEVGVDENLLIDSDDEPYEINPPVKKSVNRKINKKQTVAQKIRKKCILTLNKKQEKNKENLNEEKNLAVRKFRRKENTTRLNQINLKQEDNEQEDSDLRMIFLETLTACAGKSGLFGILSKTFSCQEKMMSNLAYGCSELGVMPNAVNSSINITLNINSNFAGKSRPFLRDRTESNALNFSLSHNRIIENRNEPSGSQFSFPRKTSTSFGFQNGAILDSIAPNFSNANPRCETPKNNFKISRNCFSENFESKRTFSRLNFVSDEDERIKRFRSSYLDLEEKTRSPPAPELIKSRDLISSMKKDFNLETPKSKKSLRLCSSENAGAKNKKRKSRMKLLVDSDDEEEEDESSWSSKSSLKIFCTPKSNKKTENDGMENSDSDECEAIFEIVKKK